MIEQDLGGYGSCAVQEQLAAARPTGLAPGLALTRSKQHTIRTCWQSAHRFDFKTQPSML
eukprot:3281609-Amphidinium_carterae.1